MSRARGRKEFDQDNVATSTRSIPDISAGDGVWSRLQRLEVCAGLGTRSLHNPIHLRSEDLEDSTRTDHYSVGHACNCLGVKSDSSGQEASLVATPPASAGET